MQLREVEDGSAANAEDTSLNENATIDLIQRAMDSLYEPTPDIDDNTEEIRKLDNQLDHLNEYMDRVEERLKSHSEKLMETLKQQREEREKRRRSFHERLDANRQEDDDFQKQLSQILHRVGSLKRQSVQELASPLQNCEQNSITADEAAEAEDNSKK